MSSSTILRILTTFIEIIPVYPNFISTTQIAKQLAERGMYISQSQLSRDLKKYAALFNVYESKESNDGNKCWQRYSKTTSTPIISESDIAILNMVKDNLDNFPAFTQESLNQRLADLSKKQAAMRKVHPNHRIFQWQKNRDLITKYERQNILDNDLLKALMHSINQQATFTYTNDESASKVYTIEVLSLSEENNQLVINGFFHHENTYDKVNVSSIKMVRNNADSASPTHLLQQKNCYR